MWVSVFGGVYNWLIFTWAGARFHPRGHLVIKCYEIAHAVMSSPGVSLCHGRNHGANKITPMYNIT